MFAGAKRRRSSNVRVMQIFHELKAQFPTIPDHIISTCLTSHLTANCPDNLYDILTAQVLEQNQMGRPSSQIESSPFAPSPLLAQYPIELKESAIDLDTSQSDFAQLRISDMNESVTNQSNLVQTSDIHCDNPDDSSKHLYLKNSENSTLAKRPNTLNLNAAFDKERKLQLSEKCRDVHKLLNSPILTNKPPRSPLNSKRLTCKQNSKKDTPTGSPTSNQFSKKETVSTPTQTTDTLLNDIISPSVNLSLNVNCQMGLVQSPTQPPKCTTKVELIPSQPWLNSTPFFNNNDPSSSSSSSTSPRSFTSVNLTLRPPSSTPQNPIDITSQNSSLTYSTSSFDKAKGLQSRLQITVGPGNTKSISSVRTRPRSFHIVEDNVEDVDTNRTASLNDLATIEKPEPAALLKQQARIDRMRIELQTGNAKLVIIKQEVANLEKNVKPMAERRTSAEIEKQLRMEIKHLSVQCEQLANIFGKDEFYNNIYTGPTGSLLLPPELQQQPQSFTSPPIRRQTRGRLLYQTPTLEFPEIEGPKWNCSLCTFLNHPDLDKCEQCEMPRVLHVSAAPGDNIHIHVTPRLSRRIAHSWIL